MATNKLDTVCLSAYVYIPQDAKKQEENLAALW